MSVKNVDKKNRWRNQYITFRISPEERKILEARIQLCGCRTKQEYYLESVLHSQINAYGNPYMFIQFGKHLEFILKALREIDNIEKLNEELFEPIYIMIELINSMKENKEINNE